MPVTKDERFTEIVLVASLSIVAVVMRWPSQRVGLWHAEAATYLHTLPRTVSEVIASVAANEVAPPGFFLVMDSWSAVAGTSEAALRLPAFLCSLLLVPATYVLAKEITGSLRAGLLAAAVTTFAGEAVYTGHEARPHAMAALAAMITVFCYLRSITDRRQSASIVAMTVAGTVGVYTDYANLLIVGALAAITLVLLLAPGLRARILRLAGAIAGIVIAFLPWAPTFGRHLRDGAPWASDAWPTTSPHLLANLAYTAPLPFPGTEFTAFRRVIVAVMLLALLAAALRAYHTWLRIGRIWPPPQMYTFAITTIVFLLTTAMIAVSPFEPRALFAVVPIGWVAGTWLVLALADDIRRRFTRTDRPLQLATAGAFLAFLLPNTHYAFGLSHQPKSGLRAVAADLRQETSWPDTVVVAPDEFSPTLRYYTSPLTAAVRGIPRWNQPEHFGVVGTEALWSSTALPCLLDRNLEDWRAKGHARVAVVGPSAPSSDGGDALTRSRNIVERLNAAHTVVEQRRYPGMVESVVLYVLELAPGRPMDCLGPRR